MKIDPEFHSMICPLSEDERAQLEESLKSPEGCRDALVVWAEQDILLDGHNRYEICTQFDIPYKTMTVSLPDRDAAADWIDRNQLGRRNLKPDQIRLVRGRRYKRAKKMIGQRGTEKTGQNDPSFGHTTAQRLAKEHGVGEATIRRDAEFVDALERLKEVDPEIEQKVAAGTAPPRKQIMKAAEASLKNNQQAKRILDEKPPKRQKKRGTGENCRLKVSKPVRNGEPLPEMRFIQLPIENVEASAKSMIDIFPKTFLRELATRLLQLLKE